MENSPEKVESETETPKKKTKAELKKEKEQELLNTIETYTTDNYTSDNITLFCGDCIKKMEEIPSDSVDLILCDLPYGTTKCKWDTIIDIDQLWKHYKRIIKKPSGVILLFGQQPFTSKLISVSYTHLRAHET